MEDRRVPGVAFTRVGLLVGVPLAVVFALNSSSWAAVNLKAWTSGETLTATDLNANFDAVKAELAGLGFKAQSVANAAGATTFGSSYGNVFPAYTFTVPVARQYIIHIDVDQTFQSMGSGPRGISNYQLLVNGIATALGSSRLEGNDIQLRWAASYRVLVTLNAGSNTLQLQAMNNIGVGAVDTASTLVFTVE